MGRCWYPCNHGSSPSQVAISPEELQERLEAMLKQEQWRLEPIWFCFVANVNDWNQSEEDDDESEEDQDHKDDHDEDEDEDDPTWWPWWMAVWLAGRMAGCMIQWLCQDQESEARASRHNGLSSGKCQASKVENVKWKLPLFSRFQWIKCAVCRCWWPV